MTKEMSDNSVKDILELWRNALEKAECIERFKIEDKTIDYDLKPENTFNCNDCKSPFCFKKLEWLDGQEYDKSKLKNTNAILPLKSQNPDWLVGYI